MKNLLLMVFCTLLFAGAAAQVKIGNSDTPPANGAMLEVDGSITVRDKIYAGGDDSTLGNPGGEGQVLVSDGPGKPPRWRTLNIPSIDSEGNSYYLIYNNSFTDYTGSDTTPGGVSFDSGDAGYTTGTYTLGLARTNSVFNNFKTIGGETAPDGLTQTFEVYSDDNQVYVTFEAVAHLFTAADGDGADFGCGIFVGPGNNRAARTLKGIRTTSVQQVGTTTHPFITYTLVAFADGLSAGTYSAEVACKRLVNYGSPGNLGIGRSATGDFGVNGSNLSNFTAKTSLKIEVYEIPDPEDFEGIIEEP